VGQDAASERHHCRNTNVVRHAYTTMRPGIKIKVLRQPDDDELFHIVIEISNGQTGTSQDFYAYGDVFKDFGRGLAEFPDSIEDKVTLKIGDKDIKSAYYIFLEAFCYDRSGQSAIRVSIDNNSIAPHYHRAEFFIKAEPARINNLGQRIKKWNLVDESEFDWSLDD